MQRAERGGCVHTTSCTSDTRRCHMPISSAPRSFAASRAHTPHPHGALSRDVPTKPFPAIRPLAAPLQYPSTQYPYSCQIPYIDALITPPLSSTTCRVWAQEFLARINSKAIVVMLVVDTKPAILPNFHNDHMDALKRQLRLAYNPPVVGRQGHHHALHITDDSSEVGPMLRCLGMPPPRRPAAILARAASVRARQAVLRSYQPSQGTTSDGGPAVEGALWTGLAALSSQGCMHGAPGHWADHGPCVESVRLDCVLRAVSDAIVLKAGDRAVWPVGAKQSTEVHILVSNATDAVACLASRFKHARVVSASRSYMEDPPPTQLRAEELQPRLMWGLGYLRFAVFAQPPPSRSIMVHFNIYGNAQSSTAARDRTWAERMRRRSVWVLSPAGFAYRRLSLADEANLQEGS